MRMHAQTAAIENGFVLLLTEAYWLAGYPAVFPAGRYDDQVDSTAQFLGWARKPLRAEGMIDYGGGSQSACFFDTIKRQMAAQ